MWNGSIAFGELAIPVGLAPTKTDGEPGFRTLHEPCGQRIQRHPVCPTHGPVPESELVKGWEHPGTGQMLTITDEELAEIAPNGDRTIQIVACVSAGEIDRTHLTGSYYLLPSKDPVGQRAYLLLRHALEHTATVAVCKLVFRSAEWLAVIRPLDQPHQALVLERVVLADDRVPPTDIEDTLRNTAAPTDEERRLAGELVIKLRPLRLRHTMLESEHRSRIRALIEQKTSGQKRPRRKTTSPTQPPLPIGDLTDALRRSLPPARKPQRRTRARAAR